METEFSRQAFQYYSNIKFHENQCSGAELSHSNGQTDRQDEANSRFSNFCDGASNWHVSLA